MEYGPMPDAVGYRSANDFAARMAEMDASSGLRKECLERATYLHAMQEEGLSAIEWQAMETLYRSADSLQTVERVKALEEALKRAADIVQEAIEQGYPAPTNKVDQCSHGRFSWEDCISCYDDLLMTKVAEIRALAPASAVDDEGNK